MRNKQDFEKLVFERADEIKAHDRRMKAARLTVMPLAAAFVIVTVVGLRSSPFFSNNTTAKNDLAAEERSAEMQSEMYNAPAAAEDNDEFDAGEAPAYEAPQMNYAADDYTYENYAEAEDNDAALKGDEPAAMQSDGEAIILTQRKTVVTDSEDISELFTALTQGTETQQTGGACLGTVTFTDSNTQFRIYADHCEEYTSGEPVSSYVYTEESKVVLSEYFEM